MFFSLFFACMHQPITPKEEAQRYRVQINAQLQNMNKREKMDSFVVDLVFSVRPRARFSDDSVSYTVLVEESSAVYEGTVIPSHLEGKWIGMRAFEFGELLSIEHVPDWVEEDEYISSFDILWFILYPNPPNMKKGQTRSSLARYPLRFSDGQRGRAQIRNKWDLLSVGANIQLSYNGTFDIRGTWNDCTEEGKGIIEGDVLSTSQGGIPLKHTGVLTRSLCYSQIQKICQSQKFDFSLEQIP
jgi:hypothetical protein